MPFQSIVGHTGLVQLLRNAVARRRVPQSLLFAGPEGVGKYTVALALAQAINCRNQTDGDGCGSCAACRRIAARTYPDVVVVDKNEEASIKIDVVREKVLDLVGYRPFEGVSRVFIIDQADEMTYQAQEALLKTLEEPPPSAILILVTAWPDLLAATIRSRCRRLRFGTLRDEQVREVLTRLDPTMSSADLQRRVAAAGGSVARALAVDETEFQDDRQAAVDLLRAAQQGNVAARLKASAAFANVPKKRRAREAAAVRLAILSSLVRDLTALDARQDDAIANADLVDELRAMAPAFSSSRLVSAFAAIRHAEVSIDRNAGTKLVADWLAVTM